MTVKELKEFLEKHNDNLELFIYYPGMGLEKVSEIQEISKAILDPLDPVPESGLLIC